MELFAGLAFMGNALNNKRKPKQKEQFRENIKRSYPKNDNIYDSRQFKKETRDVWKKGADRFNQSMNAKDTGIIPKFHNLNEYFKNRRTEQEIHKSIDAKRGTSRNTLVETFNDNCSQDSVFSDDNLSLDSQRSRGLGSLASGDTLDNPTAFMDRADRLADNSYHEEKFTNRTSQEPAFTRQFDGLRFDNPNNPVPSNKANRFLGLDGGDAKLDLERNMAFDNGYSNFSGNTDMTYGIVDKNNFTHNNMVPFFASPTYGNDPMQQDNLNRVKQRKTELFTGSLDNIDYRPKTERRPLFNPTIGLSNIYGMPNFTEFMQARYVPGKERRNEFPVQQVRQTPGLNLGYNEVSKQGFNDMYRPLEKTVDQLRVANNPKISYRTAINHGMKGTRRPIVPNVAKRLPTTFWENDPRDFVKGSSYYKAQTIRGNWDVPVPNRAQTSRSWAGPAAIENDKLRPGSMIPKVKIAHRENFKGPGPMRAYRAEGKNGHAFDMLSNRPDATIRDTTQNNTYVGHAGNREHGKGHAFDMNTNRPDATRRDLTQNTTYIGHAGNQQWQKGHAFDMNSNRPDPTRRDLTQNTTYIGHAGNQQWQKGHAFDMNSNRPDPTRRDLTQNTTYIGHAGNQQWQKGHAFDMNSNRPDPTRRDLTQNTTYIGHAGNQEWHKGHAFDMNSNKPDPTRRDLTQNTTYIGHAGTLERHKGHAFDMNSNRPDPTRRDLTQNTTYIGHAGNQEWHKGHAFDMDTNRPDPTRRDMTQNTTYIGHAGNQAWQKGHAFDMDTNRPDPTRRDFTQNTTYIGHAGNQAWQKGHAFDMDSNRPDPTRRDMTQNTTWIGTAGSGQWEKGHVFDMDANIPDPTRRDMTQDTTWIGTAGTGQHEKTYAIDYDTWRPDPTRRNLTEATSKLNPAGHVESGRGGYHVAEQGTIAPPTRRQLTQDTAQLNPAYHVEAGRQRSRGDVANALVNVGAEEILKGRAPTTSNYAKGPTYEHTMVNLCEPIQVNREKYPNMAWKNPLQCIPTMHTRMGYSLPQWDHIRFDTCVPTDALKHNPYVNNTQHQSVEY